MTPKRYPCPGMGQEPEVVSTPSGHLYRGRCICPVCDQNCILNQNGTVGYHTSEHSELRPLSDQPAPPRAGLEQDLVDAMAWYSHEGEKGHSTYNQGRVWGFAIGRVGQSRALELLSFAAGIATPRYISAGHLFVRHPEPRKR